MMGLTQGQQRCVDTLDRPLVVAAGAGSGKTFTLTKRIVSALQTGYLDDIDQVCAITYTKKAAGELKSRIKAELRACGLVGQALKVDEAWVSTIHGMCARILRAHALELGIDPAFEVAEGALVDELMAQAVDEVLAQAQVDSSERIDALFREYPARAARGASVEGMLSDLVREASSHARGADAFVMPGVAAAPHIVLARVVEILDGLLVAAADGNESSTREKWTCATLEQADAIRSALDEGIDDAAQALDLVAPVKLVKSFGSKDFKAQIDEALPEFAALVMELRLGAAAGLLETLVELARRALASYAQRKRQRGVLDNNDLLVMAARAIEDNPGIAALYCDKFKLVMVDEFQDTNQMQVDMIKRLAGEGACRLCTVGDAQQSIYRFRGADVSVYRRHLETVRSASSDGVIELAANFRSHPDVLAFVDRVFEKPGMFGGEFMSLAAERDETRVSHPLSSAHPRVVVHQASIPYRGVTTDRMTEFAADRIAAEFESLIEEGHSAGEMVILLGGMPRAGVYAQALRNRGIPCVISGGSVFSGTPEAQVVSELVRALANPGQTKCLFNVLTSPLFSLNAGDLLQAGGLGGFGLKKPASGDAVSPQLECALQVMGKALRDVAELPVSQVIRNIVTESGWLSRMESEGAEGLASAANALKAIRLVEHVEQEGAVGPATVATRFAEMLASSKEAPGALSVSGGESGRLMTIHSSKGLEFPIVAVAEIRDDKPPSSKLLVSSVGEGIYLSLDLAQSGEASAKIVEGGTMDQVSAYVLGEVAGEDELACAVEEDAGALHRRLALRAYQAEGDREEAKRLLYVALTRAKEALVVALKGMRTKDNPSAVPVSALAGVVTALLGEQPLEQGMQRCEYGGALPAVYYHWALTPEDEPEDGALSQAPDEEPPLFAIPEAAPDCHPERSEGSSRSDQPEVFKPLHQAIFSYSSISDASHEGNALANLADAHFVECDEPQEGALVEEALPAPTRVFADDFWDVDPSAVFDEDRATDLGTAFHRLAQYAVVARQPGEPLAYPPAERVAALARTCNLDALQKDRLARALDRWFGSDLAGRMAAFTDLSAEVPFFVSVSQEGAPDRAYLEGEIDLLALSDDGSRAVVVDYKTGGRDDESVDDLRVKHVLQASCYAYAIMLQGVEEVEAIFTRVERSRADDPAQPQCVRYRFTSEDLLELEQAIASVYTRSTIATR
ncbi:MAG: UvrD-helicase domain-containing protein [Eggerthellaceae bacterium]|nr:UvrD-helicase domain-containing protein [Eggerthellaceae bacterium]